MLQTLQGIGAAAAVQADAVVTFVFDDDVVSTAPTATTAAGVEASRPSLDVCCNTAIAPPKKYGVAPSKPLVPSRIRV